MFNNQSTKITHSYWFLGLAQVAHSMEETYTKLYLKFGSMSRALHDYFPWIPQFEISADIFAILNYLMIALMLGTLPLVKKGNQLASILMWIWAVIEISNGAFHLGTWLVLGTYFPGGVSGPILFVLSFLFIQQLKTSPDRARSEIQQTQ